MSILLDKTPELEVPSAMEMLLKVTQLSFALSKTLHHHRQRHILISFA